MWPGHNSRTKATFLLGVLSSLYHRKMSAAGKTLVFLVFCFTLLFSFQCYFGFVLRGLRMCVYLYFEVQKGLPFSSMPGSRGRETRGGPSAGNCIKNSNYILLHNPALHTPTNIRKVIGADDQISRRACCKNTAR